MPGLPGRVLVVDDSKVIRQLIRVNLELEGFEVVTAADGAECLETVRHVRPDVVTLDVVMPRLDGLRTAAFLRADPSTRDLRIAIISACTPRELERGEAAGVDGYLGKPFEPAALVHLVRRLMRTGARTAGNRLLGGSTNGVHANVDHIGRGNVHHGSHDGPHGGLNTTLGDLDANAHTRGGRNSGSRGTGARESGAVPDLRTAAGDGGDSAAACPSHRVKPDGGCTPFLPYP